MDHVSDPFLVFLFVVVLDAFFYVLAYLLVRFLKRGKNEE
jgi:ABC-type multidrug transport system permease subunit